MRIEGASGRVRGREKAGRQARGREQQKLVRKKIVAG